MYRGRMPKDSPQLVEKSEIIWTANQEQAAIRKGWSRNPKSSHFDADHQKTIEAGLMHEAKLVRALKRRRSSLPKQNRWKMMREKLPEHLRANLPETYSEEHFHRLSALRTQPHPAPAPLSLSGDKAAELAKEFDAVPSAYIDSLLVFYDTASRTYWYEGLTGAWDRFRQMAGETYPDATDSVWNVVQLLWANSASWKVVANNSKRVIDFGEVKGEDIQLSDVFRTMGTLLRKYAAQAAITSVRSTEQVCTATGNTAVKLSPPTDDDRYWYHRLKNAGVITPDGRLLEDESSREKLRAALGKEPLPDNVRWEATGWRTALESKHWRRKTRGFFGNKVRRCVGWLSANPGHQLPEGKRFHAS